MSNMIEYMPTAWYVYGRVLGISPSLKISSSSYSNVKKTFRPSLMTYLSPIIIGLWLLFAGLWIFLKTFSVIWMCGFVLDIFELTSLLWHYVCFGQGDGHNSGDSLWSKDLPYKWLHSSSGIFWHIKTDKASRKLVVQKGVTVNIEFEYERIHKHCFHCLCLTHEKLKCPLLMKGSKILKESDLRLEVTHISLSDKVESSQKNALTDGPPGFPQIFPELPPQEQMMDMLYVSHWWCRTPGKHLASETITCWSRKIACGNSY